ncbi:MAG: IspD/TarI family cytidylyltransferase [Pseudothermotoga sp.]
MTIGILMAAGKSTRTKTSIPKQFHKICDRPVLFYSLTTFERSQLVDLCLLMVPQEWKATAEQMICDFKKVKWVLPGGNTRHETSLIAVDFVRNLKPSLVVFHDAARPFLSLKLLETVIEEAKTFGAATAAIPVADSVAYCEDGFLSSYASRESLYRIQTPQAFQYEIIDDAIRKFQADDGSKPVFLMGKQIRVVEGDPYCFKITTSKDLQLAQQICQFWKED